MIFLTLEMVIGIHATIILKKGGLSGIRDVGLLISAIEMPKAMIGGLFLHYSIYDKAAAYLYHITCNHAFLDGNKRTALPAGHSISQAPAPHLRAASPYQDAVRGISSAVIRDAL